MATERTCGECSLCCKLMGVHALDKPKGVWCRHFQRGAGCNIYDQRPAECSTFVCQWLVNEHVGPEWQPNRCKMVLVGDGANKLGVHVDPGSPGPWREPHLGWLKRMAAEGLKQNGMVLVMENGRTTLVLPDRNVDLGIVGDDERIVLAEGRGSDAGKWEAIVVKKDDADLLAAQNANS